MTNTPSSSNAASAPSTPFTSLTVATVVTTTPASMMSPMSTTTSVPVAGIVGGVSAGAAATAGTALPAVVSGGAYTGGIAGAPGAGGVGYTTGGFNFGGFPPSQVGYGFPRGAFGGATDVPVKMDNVPKMKGSFDLYAVQLRAFLTRIGCWAVVDGSIDRCDPCFAAKDNFAREAILYGVAAQDAEIICQEDTVQAMRTRFVDKQTKREYSNYIFARAEFYSHVYSADKGMKQWLREMESMRRRLLHYGKRVTDEDFAETLVGHVARTHRDVVRQFSKHYVVRGDGGADRPVPTATQVMNALRAESALDEQMGTENLKPAGIAACGKKIKPPKEKKQSPAKGKRKRSGHGKRQKDGKPGGKKSDKQETRTCYHCGEAGHIRPNCPNRDDDSSDDQAAETQTAISERKRWQKRPDKDGENKKRKVSAVGCILREALTVGSVSSAGEDTVEWALDSASDVHVCKQPELLSELQHDSKQVF
ncbi:unnamed protein product [Phytophthora fragariaefolia]|uniref:Unnamed protein product n=1 Tax=Phytophthora fragariaefolia TaxID=1490495 RepID=A0A9W6U2I0_9STRA|nr:unnamed protein product [Phytophthora fragariaefolia]